MKRTRVPAYSFAPVYDDFSSGLPGDVDFYVEEARKSKGEVLELGCGTGRILIPIAETGKHITGIDLSASMLKVCRRKVAALPDEVRRRITLVRADMRKFDRPLDRLGAVSLSNQHKRFDLIICPFRAFLHNLTAEDQKDTLNCVGRHMKPHGRFIMNNFDPRLDVLANHPTPDEAARGLHRTYFNSSNGNRVDVYEHRYYDLARQLLLMKMDFRELGTAGKVLKRVTRSLKLRYIFRYEMEHLFELAGFEVKHLWGDFGRGRFEHGGEQIWVVGPTRKHRETGDRRAS